MSSVNAFVTGLGFVAISSLATLVFGSFLLRLFGAATMLVPTVFLLPEANLNIADAGSYLVFVPMALLGLMMWVVGHRLHRAQQGWWKSPLASRLWSLPTRTHRRLAARPAHPHTQALLAAAPIADPVQQRTRQRVLLGDDLPSALNPPSGCRFHTRCPLAFDKCTTDIPPLTGVGDGTAACHLVKPDGTAPDVRDPDGARSLR